MNKWVRLLSAIVTLLFGISLTLGIYQIRYLQERIPNSNINASEIINLNQGWTYTTDKTDIPQSVTLPNKLLIGDAQQIILENTLPPKSIHDGVLRFTSVSQVVEVYIDNQLRGEYGSLDVTLKEYPYVSALHYTMIELSEEDYGKPLTIILKAPKLYNPDLSLVRTIEIGKHRDFILRDILYNASNLFISALLLALIIVLIVVGILLSLKHNNGVLFMGFAGYLLFWLVFYNSNNTLLWEVFYFNPVFSAFNDFVFFILDAFLPLISYTIILTCMEKNIKGWQKKCIKVHFLFYIIGIVLQILGVMPINYFRPFLMFVSMCMYAALGYTCIETSIHKKYHYFLGGAFVLMLGYFLDYIKYAIALLPLSFEVIVFLQLELPLMFFLGIALVVCAVFFIIGIVDLFQQQRLEVQQQRDFSNFQLKLTKQVYESTLQNQNQLRALRHDMTHHMRVLNTLLVQEKREEAIIYTEQIIHRMECIELVPLCKSYLANMVIGWFKSKAEAEDITFTYNIDIPQEEAAASMDLCAILSNALQNALEACKEMEKDEKFIHIKAKAVGTTLIITVENSYEGEIKERDGKFISHKNDKDHGIGLISITDATARHKGYVDIHYDEYTFKLSLTLGNVLKRET